MNKKTKQERMVLMEDKKRIEEIIEEMEAAANDIGNYSGCFREKTIILKDISELKKELDIKEEL